MSQYPTSSNAAASATGSNTLIIVGGVLAVLAVILMNFYVEMRVKAQNEETITYFKFTEELGVGEEVTLKNITPVETPVSWKEAFGEGAILEDSERPGKPIAGLGTKLTKPVIPNQMLTSNLFIRSGSTIPRDPAYRNLDEITLNIDSKEQPPNLRPGDFVDLYASVPLNRSTRHMRIMEYVRVKDLGDRIQDSGATAGRANKYGSITIYVDPTLSGKLFDIQKRVEGQTFNVTRRDPNDKKPRELKTGGSKEINEQVLTIFRLKDPNS